MQSIDASTWLSQAAVEKLGWVLVHSFWQLTVIALLAWLLDRALQRRSSSVRYGSLLLSLLVMMASPVVTWLMLPTSLVDDVSAVTDANPGPGLMMSETPLPATNMEPITPVEDIQNSVAEIQESSAMKSASFSRWMNQCAVLLKPWLGTIVSVWCFGVLLFSIRPVVSWVNVQRLKRQGTSAVSESVRQSLTMLAQKLQVHQRVDVMMSTVVSSPIVVGCFRSVILLPASFIAGVPPAQLEAILAHELAHVKRYDYFVNLPQTLVETLFFYHPAVWWLSHRIRIERENCCDDMVVTALNNKVDYGRALLAIEEHRGQASALALSAKGGSLVARVRRLFSEPVHDGSQTAAGILSFGTLLALLLIATMWPHAAVVSDEVPAANQEASVEGDKSLLKRLAVRSIASPDNELSVKSITPRVETRAQLFERSGDLAKKLADAKKTATEKQQRIAILIAKPDSQQADWFYSLLQGTDDDVKRWKVGESAIKEIRQSLPRFQLLWVDAAQFDELRRLIPDHEFEDQHESSMVFLDSDGSWLCHFEPDPTKEPRRSLENLGSALDLHKEGKKNAGKLQGRIHLDGEVPRLAAVSFAPGAVGNAIGVTVADESLSVGKKNGLANVFIYLKKAPAAGSEPSKTDAPAIVKVTPTGFSPRSSILQTGQGLIIDNTLPVAANAVVYPIKNQPFNLLIGPTKRDSLKSPFKNRESVPVRLVSDIHPWMHGYALALDHPFAAVSDSAGEFHIGNLPPGEHEFSVWHERVGFLEPLRVQIKGNEATIADLPVSSHAFSK